MNDDDPRGIAPADARPRAAWPVWKKLLAYGLMALLSLAAIWLVDVKVHRAAVMPRGSMGFQPMFAVFRDFDRYPDRRSQSGAIFD